MFYEVSLTSWLICCMSHVLQVKLSSMSWARPLAFYFKNNCNCNPIGENQWGRSWCRSGREDHWNHNTISWKRKKQTRSNCWGGSHVSIGHSSYLQHRGPVQVLVPVPAAALTFQYRAMAQQSRGGCPKASGHCTHAMSQQKLVFDYFTLAQVPSLCPLKSKPGNGRSLYNFPIKNRYVFKKINNFFYPIDIDNPPFPFKPLYP